MARRVRARAIGQARLWCRLAEEGGKTSRRRGVGVSRVADRPARNALFDLLCAAGSFALQQRPSRAGEGGVIERFALSADR